jgi:ubiquitin C-terminal hydrolase
VPNPQGFVNPGANCYFNSLLQGLMSCPSIYQVLSANRDKQHIKSNRLAQNLITLMDATMAGQSIYDMCLPIWRDIIAISQNSTSRVKMDSGQQDANEGLMMFFDAMEHIPEVRRLFEHRHSIAAQCSNCKETVINRREVNCVFEVQQDLKMAQLEKFKDIDKFYNTPMHLNQFLKQQNSYLDAAHLCDKCGNKELTPFPAKLEFMCRNGREKYIYGLVAQIEHSGSMEGGHYWAICLRKSGWFNLNDSSVSSSEPGPTVNTYMVFYHYMGTERI